MDLGIAEAAEGVVVEAGTDNVQPRNFAAADKNQSWTLDWLMSCVLKNGIE